MPAVSSVQRGSRTILVGDGLSITQAIAAVDVSRSVVMFTSRNEDNQAREARHFFSARLSSSGQITFSRTQANFAVPSYIEWTVVEFSAGALQSLQAGYAALPAGSGIDLSITPVNTAAAFPIMGTEYSATAGMNVAQLPIPLLVQTTLPGDTLRLESAAEALSVSGSNCAWQVVEFKSADVKVQTVVANTGTVYGVTPTIDSVNLGKTLLAYFVNGGSRSAARMYKRGYFSSSTQIKIDEQALGSALAWRYAVYAVEMLDNSRVESGGFTIAAGSTAPASAPSWPAMTNGAVFSHQERPNARLLGTSDSFLGHVFTSVSLSGGQDGASILRSLTTPSIEMAYQAVDWAAGGGGTTEGLATPSGVSASSAVGTVSASGGAVANPAGVSATASIGTATATGGTVIPATATPAGVSATSAIGSPTATGGASAQPSGVSASAQIGTTAGKGGATAQPAGVSAQSAVGIATATGAGAGAAMPSGVSAAGSVGTPAASGGASVAPAGVSAVASVGTASASGISPVYATPAGVGATASVGTVSVSAGATAEPPGVSVLATVGSPIAEGEIHVAGLAMPAGVVAYAYVGVAVAFDPTTRRQYPLAGLTQSYPLSGKKQTYPLEGRV